MAKISKKEREEALNRLREWVKPGDTVYCILRACSRSGMSRVIDLVVLDKDSEGRTTIGHIGYNAALALGWSYDRKREGIIVGGCGMDMGFHVVYELSGALYRGSELSAAEADAVSADLKREQPGYWLKHRWL